MQFIGGFTAKHAIHTVKQLQARRIRSIIDYAKEGSSHQADVMDYVHNLNMFMDEWSISKPRVASPPALALKLSSFNTSQNPALDMYKIIRNARAKMGCELVMFDAESPNAKGGEDSAYDQTISYLEQTHTRVTLMKTIQAYRRDSLDEVQRMLKRQSPNIGVKLVRGAYHNVDDKRFYQAKSSTDDNYDAAVEVLCSDPRHSHVCFATHNVKSVRRAEKLIEDHARTNVHFAQLLGMADSLTNSLSDGGHRVYKYVPYGSIRDMTPYLIRRLYENYPILQHTL